ncbi:MAG: N-acetylglucosamine-6-phosphate deacetylase [Aggregatilineales bacterium]
MAGLLIKNARIITSTQTLESGWLLCEDGKIVSIDSGDTPSEFNGEIIDAGGKTLLPGFIDLHVHGAKNHEAMDATPEALATMGRFYAQHGVTGYLATTWTDNRERITAALRNIANCVDTQADGATLLGAHLEGPYLNAEKGGAQNNTYIRRADKDEAQTFLDLNIIKLLAIAPEFPENHWLIEACAKRGITVSAAHTSATYEDIRHAVDLGLSQSTHTFNAQTSLHHREPGTVGAVLTMPQIRCELIADNVHVHPAVMNLLYRAKGAEGVILISDAVRSAGMPDGDYPIDDRTITVKEGVARLPDGTLAGSTLTMDRALYNFQHATGETLDQLWRSTSLNAAQAIGIADKTGSLEIGKTADLVLIDENIIPHVTIANGRIIYRKDTENVSS